MVINPPSLYRPGQHRVKRKRTLPPPAALTLVAAAYGSGVWVRLTFDRAIDIAGIDVSTVLIDDDGTDQRYQGTGSATLTSATTVQVNLFDLGAAPQGGRVLTVDADSGIVAVNDGGTWAGVTNQVIPFP